MELVLLGAVGVAASAAWRFERCSQCCLRSWRCGFWHDEVALANMHVVSAQLFAVPITRVRFLFVLFLLVMLLLGRGAVAWRRRCATCAARRCWRCGLSCVAFLALQSVPFGAVGVVACAA